MQTPLHQHHQALKAQLTDFAGWQMPLKYGSETTEHCTVRSDVGLFDLSHMGEIYVSGNQALEFLNYALISDLSKVAIGKAKYTMICNESGGVIDDLVVYRLAETEFMVVANAANANVVAAELLHRAHSFDVSVIDRSLDTALVAVQGPNAKTHLKKFVSADLIDSLKNYSCVETEIAGIPVLLARTGYTGEDGFEIFTSVDQIAKIWELFIAEHIMPIGLAARDTLRLEAGMPLYGHELNLEITPIHAGLSRTIAFAKSDFVGKSALNELSGELDRKLVGIELETRRIARAGFNLIDEAGQVVGQVTSGAFSPTLGKSIAMAYLDAKVDLATAKISVDIRGNIEPATVVSLPFYRREA
ncbi:MAG: glycine cleavage system protein [Actinomycetota bacterium]|jgi:aminomethyltransferase